VWEVVRKGRSEQSSLFGSNGRSRSNLRVGEERTKTLIPREEFLCEVRHQGFMYPSGTLFLETTRTEKGEGA